jgi:hypothetical protein
MNMGNTAIIYTDISHHHKQLKNHQQFRKIDIFIRIRILIIE